LHRWLLFTQPRAPPDTAVHDSQKLDDVLDLSNTGKKVWADSAYRSVQIEAGLKEKGLQSRIHRRAARNRLLSERQKSANTTRSKVRARVEHIRPPAELLYFPDEPMNRRDGLFRRELVMRMAEAGDGLHARFDFVVDTR
jgi:IS5 family transposase